MATKKATQVRWEKVDSKITYEFPDGEYMDISVNVWQPGGEPEQCLEIERSGYDFHMPLSVLRDIYETYCK